MNNKLFRLFTTWPIIIYVLLFIAFPILYILYLSFLTTDYYGGMLNIFTFSNYLNFFNIVYLKVFLKSFLIAGFSTFLCMVIAYPFVIFISQKSEKVKSFLMTFVMVPFLTNSLIRTYGWIVLLRKTGIINTFLQNMNITSSPISFIYNNSS